VLAWRIVLHIGILSDYRRPFWRAARHALRRGQIDGMLGMGFIAYHLINFTREALRGEQNASYYSAKMRDRGADNRAMGPDGLVPLRKSAQHLAASSFEARSDANGRPASPLSG
jgi:hypothetical protein